MHVCRFILSDKLEWYQKSLDRKDQGQKTNTVGIFGNIFQSRNKTFLIDWTYETNVSFKQAPFKILQFCDTITFLKHQRGHVPNKM